MLPLFAAVAAAESDAGIMLQSSNTTHIYHTRSEYRIDYGDHRTSYYTANNNPSFCLNPGVTGIETGTYSVSRHIERGTGYDLLFKCAFYLYGGPGYNSVKYSYFDTPDDLVSYGLSHAIMAYVWTWNEEASFIGLGDNLRVHLHNVISSINNLPMPPSGFNVFIYNEGYAEYQSFLGWEYAPVGHVEVRKTSGNTSMSNNNDLYSLQGAVFDVFNSANKKLGSITTGANGRGRLNNLDALQTGLYVVEVKPPKGFALSSSKIQFELVPDQVTSVTVRDRPQNNPVSILISKQDAETSIAAPQGGASLMGAEFTVCYYAGLYESEDQLSEVTPVRTWVFRTDVKGTIRLDPSYLVSGDPLYTANNGAYTLPLGTVTIQETLAPEGYIINNEIFIRQITSHGTAETVTSYNAPVIDEKVIRGGAHIEKWDNETLRHEAQGGATLEGAVFEIINRSPEAVMVQGEIYGVDAVVYSMKTDCDGTAKTSSDLLPYGTYEVREVSPPDHGYLATGILCRTFSIREQGEVVKLNTADTAIRNDPIRGDLRGVKISDGDAYRMANVPFKITSVTTGESHVIITDNNGEINTASNWNSHSQYTNRGKTDRDGIWFGDIETLNDDAGALLYGVYLIEELPCKENEGRALFSFEVSIYRHDRTVNLGTLSNKPAHRPAPSLEDLPVPGSAPAPAPAGVVASKYVLPQTGDDTDPVGWWIALFVSALFVVSLLMWRRYRIKTTRDSKKTF